MTNSHCLFCARPENGSFKPDPDIEFICGICVQSLLNADSEDVKRAYRKALDLGDLRKAKAIETFLTPGRINEQRKPESKKCGRYSNRAGIIKSVRNQKERIKRVAV
jgi:hypothetical protein